VSVLRASRGGSKEDQVRPLLHTYQVDKAGLCGLPQAPLLLLRVSHVVAMHCVMQLEKKHRDAVQCEHAIKDRGDAKRDVRKTLLREVGRLLTRFPLAPSLAGTARRSLFTGLISLLPLDCAVLKRR
jgi:hypothetical protein